MRTNFPNNQPWHWIPFWILYDISNNQPQHSLLLHDFSTINLGTEFLLYFCIFSNNQPWHWIPFLILCDFFNIQPRHWHPCWTVWPDDAGCGRGAFLRARWAVQVTPTHSVWPRTFTKTTWPCTMLPCTMWPCTHTQSSLGGGRTAVGRPCTSYLAAWRPQMWLRQLWSSASQVSRLICLRASWQFV